MKIFDCFPYFNEKEILELRIKTLYEHVDGFVIVEADRTHSGNFKEYTCASTLNSLGIPLDKIQILHAGLQDFDNVKQEWIDLIVGNRIKNNQSITDTEEIMREIKVAANWARERNQRNVMQHIFEESNIYLVSDCDEIVNPEYIPSIKQTAANNPSAILRLSFAYLHCRPDLRLYYSSGDPVTFYDPFICTKYHAAAYTLSAIRESHSTGNNIIKDPILYLGNDQRNLGWHFSWMGTPERLKYKMQSFAHSDDQRAHLFSSAAHAINSQDMYNRIDTYIPKDGAIDLFGRNDHILKYYPKENLPNLIFENTNIKQFMFGVN
jgi:beta-1,4-mannosyl-glycoprotein beta-1,4-N-acetylglucosaminyltransferase